MSSQVNHSGIPTASERARASLLRGASGAARCFAVLRVLAILTVLLSGFVPASALAGEITAASDTISVNGTELTLAKDARLVLEPGDVVETLAARVTWTSAAGDHVRLAPRASVRAEGTEGRTDLLLLTTGSAEGALSSGTSVGTVAGWVSAAANAAKARVTVSVDPKSAATDASFRCQAGGAWVQYAAYQVWLPPAQSVALSVDAAALGRLGVVAAAGNTADVRVYRSVAGARLEVLVPIGGRGGFDADETGNLSLHCDLASAPERRFHLGFVSSAEGAGADVGPGAHADVNARTKRIAVAVPFVSQRVLAAILELSAGFAALARTAFSDLR